MPRLNFLDSAKRDIAAIAAYIEDESGDRRVADKVAEDLVIHCRRIASLESTMGRPREELRQGNLRDQLIVIHVMRATRDIEAYFTAHPDDEIDK
jgi:plasmid stabilization system protein ParE